MLWLTPIVLPIGPFIVVMFLCVAAVTQTPKERRGDQAADLLRAILGTLRRRPR
jgi:hypothetical protein